MGAFTPLWAHLKSGNNRSNVPVNHPAAACLGMTRNEEQSGKLKNTKRTEAGAVSVAMEFQNVSVAHKEVCKGLDEWLVGFVKFTVDVQAIHLEEIKQKKYLEKRKKVCGKDYKGGKQFVPSSKRRFPEFNSYFAHVDKLYKV